MSGLLGISRTIDQFNERVGKLMAWAILAAMTIVFVALLGLCAWMEQSGNPRLAGLGVDQTASQQQAGGGWGIYAGGPADLSTTVEAYTALRLAGDPVDADHMRRAAERVRDAGGIEGSRVFTRLWLALFGEWSWRDLPALPPEVILLPAWFPLNVYDFGCWARQTIVPLTVVAAHRPARALGFPLAELRTGRPPAREGVSLWR